MPQATASSSPKARSRESSLKSVKIRSMKSMAYAAGGDRARSILTQAGENRLLLMGSRCFLIAHCVGASPGNNAVGPT